MSTNKSPDDAVPEVDVVALQALSITDAPHVPVPLSHKDEDPTDMLSSKIDGGATSQSPQVQDPAKEKHGSHPECAQPPQGEGSNDGNQKQEQSKEEERKKRHDMFWGGDSDEDYDSDDYPFTKHPVDKWEGDACELPDSYCPICLKTSPLSLCQGCKDISYCSKICQKSDWRIHKTLCRKLHPFTATTRPSSRHHRAILFPANEPDTAAAVEEPRFVWLPGGCGIDSYDQDRYFPPRGACDLVQCDHGMGSQWKRIATQPLYVIIGEGPFLDPKLQQRNKCLDNTIGGKYIARSWLGNVLVWGGRSDVSMRDFRAAVDYFQTTPWNHALIDPSRYFDRLYDPRLVAVLAFPERHLGFRQVTVLDSMIQSKTREVVSQLNGVVPMYAFVNESPGSHGGMLVLPSPAPSGVITYIRKDKKPLLLQHFQALMAFIEQETGAAAAEQPFGLKPTEQQLQKRFTKALFRKFWDYYCEAMLIRNVLCPLDI